jgi:GTP-binding protein
VSGRRPVVAVVGRVNVGKSTLVNRLFGRRAAIAHDQPGVTRDRVELPVSWRGREFTVVDTGGYIPGGKGLDAQVRAQAEVAAEHADVILFVVDAETGVQEEDAFLGRRLRQVTTPVVLVANKLDQPQPSPADSAPFYALGLGDPIAVSALHGYGSDELLDRVLSLLPEPGDEEPDADEPGEARIAIVGRPNVGKSSLFNRLVGEERAVVHETAGTTRDAVDSVVEVDGRVLRFVDTAGFRKRTRLQGVAYYGMVRALQAIDLSEVALVVVDASDGVTGEDKRILDRTEEAGRGLVAVANKWDLIESGERERRLAEIREDLAVFPGVPVLRTSALSGQGVHRLLPELLRIHDVWSKRVSTSDVNQVLQAAAAERPPPRSSGRPLYGAQVGTGPPRFVIFGTGPVPPTYRRFLENRLRKELGFPGVPIRIAFRERRRRKR